ncbi:hypothetical protein [Seonamhaeicola sp.]|uniref:hypothetical protein n=1 Tax=Seonamhaeicola sp. TaxID=1912245 RepID=UPI0026385AF6|nr:hypothetical protein [Seonamhaeicola sp.]
MIFNHSIINVFTIVFPFKVHSLTTVINHKYRFSCHAELVSASHNNRKSTLYNETLKQVQGDTSIYD